MLWLLVIVAALGGAFALNALAGRPVPFLRLDFIRFALGMPHLMKTWQVGDGREEAVARFVVEKAPRGDLDAVIAAIDEFGWKHKFLINVGDEKGKLLDSSISRVQPRRVLEVGAYVGYSALRIARMLPAGGQLFSVEYSEANASIARRIVEHAGASDRVTFLVGTLADDGKTIATLKQHTDAFDLVFLDHDKTMYLPDLKRLIDAGLLHEGTVVVADNVGFPGVPDYKKYMEHEEGRRWQTTTHVTHAEYQSVIKDLVLESVYLGSK
jgi:catechol O-methyltransferase